RVVVLVGENLEGLLGLARGEGEAFARRRVWLKCFHAIHPWRTRSEKLKVFTGVGCQAGTRSGSAFVVISQTRRQRAGGARIQKISPDGRDYQAADERVRVVDAAADGGGHGSVLRLVELRGDQLVREHDQPVAVCRSVE